MRPPKQQSPIAIRACQPRKLAHLISIHLRREKKPPKQVSMVSKPYGFEGTRTPISTAAHGHLADQVWKLGTNHVGCERGQKPAFELGPGTVHANLIVGHRSEKQETIVRDAASGHIGLDDASRCTDGLVELWTVRTNNQRDVGVCRKSKPRPRQIIHSRCSMSSSRAYRCLCTHLGNMRTQLPNSRGSRSARICACISGNRAAS